MRMHPKGCCCTCCWSAPRSSRDSVGRGLDQLRAPVQQAAMHQGRGGSGWRGNEMHNHQDGGAMWARVGGSTYVGAFAGSGPSRRRFDPPVSAFFLADPKRAAMAAQLPDVDGASGLRALRAPCRLRSSVIIPLLRSA